VIRQLSWTAGTRPPPQTPNGSVPARIVRVQGCGDGWYEVGAVLLSAESDPKDEG